MTSERLADDVTSKEYHAIYLPAVPAILGSATALASRAASMSKPGSDTSSPGTPAPEGETNIATLGSTLEKVIFIEILLAIAFYGDLK